MARRLDEAQNRILAMAVDRNDATIRPIRRGRHPVRLHAFTSETGPNALAERIIANWSDKANRRAAAGRHDRLIGAFAAKIFRRSKSHDRFDRAAGASPLESRYRPRRCRSHGSSCPVVRRRARRPLPVSASDARRRKPAAGSRPGYGRSCAGPCRGASGAARSA